MVIGGEKNEDIELRLKEEIKWWDWCDQEYDVDDEDEDDEFEQNDIEEEEDEVKINVER